MACEYFDFLQNADMPYALVAPNMLTFWKNFHRIAIFCIGIIFVYIHSPTPQPRLAEQHFVFSKHGRIAMCKVRLSGNVVFIIVGGLGYRYLGR